jgi:voltage-gated potassium channel
MQSSARTIIYGLTFFCLTWIVAIVGYWSAGWGLLDAVYMTTITIFGVGYGEVRPMTDPRLRIFTMFVIIAGCSSTAYVVGGFVQMLAEGQINRVLGARRMTKGISQLSNHTLLCGYGRVGQQLAKELLAAHQKFVIIDTNLERLREAEALGCLVLVGDCTEEEVLKLAGIDRARVVASVLSDDAANVFLTLTARDLNATVQIIARAESPSTEKKLLRSGANRVVLPTAIGATKIANLISRPSMEAMLMDDSGVMALNEQLESIGLKIQEFPVGANSNLAGNPLSRIEANTKGGYVIVAIQRLDGSLLRQPDRDTMLAEGDVLMVMGHASQLEHLKLHSTTRQVASYRGRNV